jgi:HD superfamily phosphohydrolase
MEKECFVQRLKFLFALLSEVFMSQAVYRNEQHAIIRAMAVDSISTCKPAQWQTQYSSGYVEDLTKKHIETESLSANDRLTQDSMTRARIHRNTSLSAFYAVVAKYGADEQERANAVNELVKAVVCDGVSDDFKRLIIWTWASVSVKRGFIERIVDMCDQSRATIFRKKKAITDQLNELEKTVSTDLSVILKDVCLSG